MDFFQGPVDLLLQLVKQNDLPIEKVSLAEVASQYLECVEAIKLIDLDIAGEYLVIAATLLSIKSSVLLDEPVELVPDEDGNLIDPHEELLQRLREAAIYRDGANFLESRKCLGIDVFAPPTRLADYKEVEASYGEHDPMLLGRAFRRLLEKVDKGVYTVSFENISVVKLMTGMVDKLKQQRGPLSFLKLIPDLTNRSVILGSFIAMLELCKRQVIQVSQSDVFSDININLIDEFSDTSMYLSDFDAEEVANG